MKYLSCLYGRISADECKSNDRIRKITILQSLLKNTAVINDTYNSYVKVCFWPYPLLYMTLGKLLNLWGPVSSSSVRDSKCDLSRFLWGLNEKMHPKCLSWGLAPQQEARYPGHIMKAEWQLPGKSAGLWGAPQVWVQVQVILSRGKGLLCIWAFHGWTCKHGFE